MNEIYVVLSALQFLWLVGLSFRALAAKPGEEAGKAAQAACELAERIRGRMDVMEERMRHMPNSDELAELEGVVKTIQTALLGLSESLGVVRSTVARIDSYLLHRSSGSAT